MAKLKIKNYPMGPFPTVLAGADVQGKPNYVTAGACGVVCMEPVLYVSLKSTHYTTGGVKENGYFSINIPSTAQVQLTDYCGIVSGKTTDKSGLFTTFYDELGGAPLIQECAVNFLCKVFQTVPVSGFDLFLGEIVATYINDQCLTDGKPDPLKIDPIIMMATQYLKLGQTIGAVYKEGTMYKQSLNA